MGGSDKKNLRRGGREQRKRIGQGEGVRRAEDGSSGGRVGLSVVCRVRFRVVRWVRSRVVSRRPLLDRRRKPTEALRPGCTAAGGGASKRCLWGKVVKSALPETK